MSEFDYNPENAAAGLVNRLSEARVGLISSAITANQAYAAGRPSEFFSILFTHTKHSFKDVFYGYASSVLDLGASQNIQPGFWGGLNSYVRYDQEIANFLGRVTDAGRRTMFDNNWYVHKGKLMQVPDAFRLEELAYLINAFHSITYSGMMELSHKVDADYVDTGIGTASEAIAPTVKAIRDTGFETAEDARIVLANSALHNDGVIARLMGSGGNEVVTTFERFFINRDQMAFTPGNVEYDEELGIMRVVPGSNADAHLIHSARVLSAATGSLLSMTHPEVQASTIAVCPARFKSIHPDYKWPINNIIAQIAQNTPEHLLIPLW
ncbi:hypothetical protein KC909_02415 [Candidatus Dojkabacteria bacterium]|uniref:Uncharacterized protein n=1 Tax=Candidatus Dojkabacteria bacterium TaxID=2099670 RepID=A0A955L553_9BACT|nr:hypothetical protein [Candidatus Dojkabacteria bacterium]